MKRTLITSALPYANGHIHLGHASGAYLPADIYARHLRLSGEEVLYICGSDEHGVAITISAENEKSTPKAIIDKYHNSNQEAFRKFGITFDKYSRTSNELHHQTALEFFSDLLEKGYLVDKDEEQFYDETAKMFLPDRYVEGECPNCSYDKARGDQCDKCGAYYNQLDLKNPKSVISGNKPIVKKTTHWYMKFGEFQAFLEEYIENNAKDWKDNVIQQSRSWLKQGLADRAITRDLNWGVRLDKVRSIDKEKSKGKVLYVWFDAVLGYISMTKEWALEQAKSNREHQDWRKWWQDESTDYIAFIGKDNIVFHTLIFPAMLYAKSNENEKYILPHNVPANEFLNLEGQKFSKSRNWSIDLIDFQKDFVEPQYTDSLRYCLAVNFPETRDSDFTWKDFQARNNNELADIFGNFVNRVMQFIFKNFDQKIPNLPDDAKSLPVNWNNLIDHLDSIHSGDFQETFNSIPPKFKEFFSEEELLLIFSLWKGANESARLYRKFRFRDAITETMNIARAANKFFNDTAPWKTLKNDMNTCSRSLFICSQLVNSLSIYLAPILPNSCKRIQRMFGLETQIGEANNAIPSANIWQTATAPTLEQGQKFLAPTIIFNKIDDETIEKQIAKLGAGIEDKNETELIDFEYFQKIKLKTAKVIEAEKLKKSKKLLKLKVQIGSKTKQIIAGVAEHYSPEELLGKIIIVVDNLKPATLMGEQSEGMMLAASDAQGKLCFVTPEKSDFVDDAVVK